MKATIESTEQFATIDGADACGGVPARVWRGRTERGVEFVAYITRIQVPVKRGIGPLFEEQDVSEFERELREEPHTELTVGGYELRGPIDIRLVV